MSALTLQLNSQTHWLADGIDTLWNFQFSGGYIDPSHVKAYKVSPEGVRTELTVVLSDLVGPYQLRVSPAVPAGHTLVVYRSTPRILPLVDFTDGGGVTEESLDTTAKQAIFVVTESFDRQSVLEADPTIIQGVAGGGVFFENAQRVTSNYTITEGFNAFSAGPVTIDPGITVVIPPGSRWFVG